MTYLFSALDLICLGMTEIARLRKYKVDVASLTSETSKAEKNQVGLPLPPTSAWLESLTSYIFRDIGHKRSLDTMSDEQASL